MSVDSVEDSFVTARQNDLVVALSGATGSGQCCPPVVDLYSWIGLLGGIALATYFLRVAIITNIMRRRRSFNVDHFPFLLGMILFISQWFRVLCVCLFWSDIHLIITIIQYNGEEEVVG